MLQVIKDTRFITYRSYSLGNFESIPQVEKLSDSQKFEMKVVGNVLPFKTNNYVINELIDWDNIPDDPMFRLTFPQKDMLIQPHYEAMAQTLSRGGSKDEIKAVANSIRSQLNPHPAGQKGNIPEIDGVRLTGLQHKYKQTVLFFPSQGQTCHAYCTFCFRWPQFVGMEELKFAAREADLLAKYVKRNREITDVLFTGGDPLIMKTKMLSGYIDKLLDGEIENLQTIRIGTKAFGYWPYRFTKDDDAGDLLRLFEKIVGRGINLAVMAHFNHPVELSTRAVADAIKMVRATGAQIRTQSPVLRHINDSPGIWADMWRKQVNHNCIPYYMFIPRDTGAQHYFAVPLVEAWHIFRNAYQKVSGVCRTVRGPSMSCTPGKVQVLGVSELRGEKIFVLRMLQGRNPDWVARPFFAAYDPDAIWMDDLKPAFDEGKFFFEDELELMFNEHITDDEIENFE
ncbi:MAG: lysine 2,3-aminomutase [Bacteroidota bacterium]